MEIPQLQEADKDFSLLQQVTQMCGILQLQEFSSISLHILPDRDLWSVYVLK